MIQAINSELISKVQAEANISPRKRSTYNFHKEFSDPINRMLNAINPGSYVQPHKHENPDKREVFLLLTGKALLVFFDNSGNITEHIIIDKEQNYGVEIPPQKWHMLISLEEGTVVYEIKDGPYNPDDDKNFAPWAPSENSSESNLYLDNILKKCSFNDI